jgi:anti-sigma-K factor RskA
VSYTQEDERKAHIANMEADTHYKVTLTRLEPWKTIIAVMAAIAVVVGVVAGVVGYKIGSTPPVPIIIQLPPQPQRG